MPAEPEHTAPAAHSEGASPAASAAPLPPLGERTLAQIAHLQRIATVGQLAGEMTHEIRQPLAAIRNFAEAGLNLLRDGNCDADQLQEVLATIFVQAGQAQQLSRSVTSYLREMPEAHEPLQLPALLEEVLPLIEFEAENENVEIVVDLEEGLPSFRGARIEIDQVLVNLLRNAVESVVERGGEQRRVTILGRSTGKGSVQIDVVDTGVGLSGRDAEQLFMRYFTTKPEGLGLGLSVSRQLIESHGGSLWAEQTTEGGARFSLILPAA